MELDVVDREDDGGKRAQGQGVEVGVLVAGGEAGRQRPEPAPAGTRGAGADILDQLPLQHTRDFARVPASRYSTMI